MRKQLLKCGTGIRHIPANDARDLLLQSFLGRLVPKFSEEAAN